jgi:hypothetical protein
MSVYVVRAFGTGNAVATAVRSSGTRRASTTFATKSGKPSVGMVQQGYADNPVTRTPTGTAQFND